ncbi:hypothetical protein APHAL10511_006829 [Amanita phalloides]|nr:hypothetical protein APHAL10511_006829 [Amanita phalloides]
MQEAIKSAVSALLRDALWPLVRKEAERGGHAECRVIEDARVPDDVLGRLPDDLLAKISPDIAYTIPDELLQKIPPRMIMRLPFRVSFSHVGDIGNIPDNLLQIGTQRLFEALDKPPEHEGSIVISGEEVVFNDLRDKMEAIWQMMRWRGWLDRNFASAVFVFNGEG